MAVFPSPNDVMSILVQRVLEQRVTAILDKLLVKPSLVNLPPVEQGGLLLYLRVLAVAYEKTQDLARELHSVGCGDLDVEGLTESLFLAHKDDYPEHEQASLGQLYQAKMEELRAEIQQQSDAAGNVSRSKTAINTSSHQQISVTVVTEFVRWNEEAISRCILISFQVERLLSTEQKATDYRTPDDGLVVDHRPTNACIRVVAYLSRVLEVAFTALEGLNKQSFLSEL